MIKFELTLFTESGNKYSFNGNKECFGISFMQSLKGMIRFDRVDRIYADLYESETGEVLVDLKNEYKQIAKYYDLM